MRKTHNANKNRDFGFLLSLISFSLSIYMYKENSSLSVVFFFILSLNFLFISLSKPNFFSPLAKIWYLFGSLLGRITSPIILGVIFFGLITPIAVFLKLIGRDELSIRKMRVNTYWVSRESGESISSSFKNQF